MADYLAVCMLEPIEVGTQFTQWPLHMTIVPWFKAPDLTAVEEKLKPIAAEHRPFDVEVGERAYFGPRGKLPVMRIENIPELQSLHEDILRAVTESGWHMEGRYTGQHYTPHVTQKGGSDAQGKLHFENFYIAEALPQGYRKIIAKLELGK